jgi:hypothetical protein
MKKKLKRAVLKQELFALTGDHIRAIFLQQFLYWGERGNDVDEFIAEENELRREENKDELPLRHGWIYKSARELLDETMLDVSADTARRRLCDLVKAGWLDERPNTRKKFDRSIEYRPNLQKISAALRHLGFHLDGYPDFESPTPFPQGAASIPQGAASGSATLDRENRVEMHDPRRTEITSEITNTTANDAELEKVENSFFDQSGDPIPAEDDLFLNVPVPEPAPKRSADDARRAILAAIEGFYAKGNGSVDTPLLHKDVASQAAQLLADSIAKALHAGITTPNCISAAYQIVNRRKRRKGGGYEPLNVLKPDGSNARMDEIHDALEYAAEEGKLEHQSPFFVARWLQDYFAREKIDDAEPIFEFENG